MNRIPPSTITKTAAAIQTTATKRRFCSIAGSPTGLSVLCVASGAHAASSRTRAASPTPQSTFLRTFPLPRGSASEPAGGRDARTVPPGARRLCTGSNLLRIRVQPHDPQVHDVVRDEQRGEPDEGDHGGATTLPTGRRARVEVAREDRPRDERPRL